MTTRFASRKGVSPLVRRLQSVLARLLWLGALGLALTPDRTAAQVQTCALYPIALPASVLSNAAPGVELADLMQGTQPGNFGWLTWAGSPSELTLIASLIEPGDSATYINPSNALDHQVSVGDWMRGKPGVSNSKAARDALDALKQIDITLPVWSETRGAGDQAMYRVSAFARVRLLHYQLPGQNRISARFLGYVACAEENQPPLVSAGPDLNLTLPASAVLNGSVIDDGLPVGGSLTQSWSLVSGPGTVTFGNSNVPVTTAIFEVSGTYVLRLTATDSAL